MADDTDEPKTAMSWADAKATGAKTYHSKVCDDCGTTKRRYPGGECVACGNEKALQKYHDGAPARAAAKEAKRQAKVQGRLDLMAEEGTENLLTREEAERLEKAEARKQRESAKAKQRRLDKMAEEGTEVVRKQERTKRQANKDPEKEKQRSRKRHRAGKSGWRWERLKTPKWLTPGERAEMEVVKKARKPDEHVDHIVPRDDHPEIAGLHVPWNIRLLTGPKNDQRSKGKADAFTCTAVEAAQYIEAGMAVWKADIDDEGHIKDWAKYPRPTDAIIIMMRERFGLFRDISEIR